MNKLSRSQYIRLRCLMPVGMLSLLLSEWAEVRGTPDGLKNDDLIKLGRGDLATNLGVALDLSQRWSRDRNSYYEYSFWSNTALIPLAAVGAGAALYRGSRDLLTGIGLAAGTVIGTNTFIDSALPV